MFSALIKEPNQEHPTTIAEEKSFIQQMLADINYASGSLPDLRLWKR